MSPTTSVDQTNPANHTLPLWIQRYVQWHKEMRAAFPGRALFDDPNGPKLLIRTCMGLCGGLNDRIGQLPWDLYLANQTNRVLLLHWQRPAPLEEFLQPNEVVWTVPKEIPNFFATGQGQWLTSLKEMIAVRDSYTDLFEGYNSVRPSDDFWNDQLDLALQRATTGDFRDKKVLRQRLLGHIAERHLEDRLRKLGESDMLHRTPSFGKIFHMFFRPSQGVQSELDQVFRQLQLVPGDYTAVHCRVRHPKAFSRRKGGGKGKDGEATPDRNGLPWEGESRAFAIATATRAIKCAQSLAAGNTNNTNTNNNNKNNSEPIYFFSDSNDLVKYMAYELRDPQFVAVGATDVVDAEALQVVQQTRIVARNSTLENVHIDKQKNRRASEYYPTFVDIFLATQARCVVYGVGFYAVLAAKISGTSCELIYQNEEWGGDSEKSMHAKVCNI